MLGTSVFISLLIQAGHPELAVRLPTWPWNLFAVLGLVGSCAGLRLFLPQHRLTLGLGSISMATGLLVALMLLALPAAIWPQGPDAPEWLQAVGLDHAFSSLPFAAVYLLLCVNLLLASLRQLPLRGRTSLQFMLLHTGIAWALLAAAAGTGTFQRGQITLREGGTPVVHMVDQYRQPTLLPVAIQLRDFRMRSAEPRLVLSQEAGPESWDFAVAVRNGREQVALGPYVVRIVEEVPSAGIVDGAVVPFTQEGAHPAWRVSITHDGTAIGGGWLHPHGRFGEALFLSLPGGDTIGLEQPRATRFASVLRLEEPDGSSRETTITVNGPLRIGPWWFYQSAFDEASGAASQLSVLDVVHDPAYPWVRIGLLLALAGVFWWLLRPWEELR